MVTVQPPFAGELLGDSAIQTKKIGDHFTKLRGDHLDDLSSIETMIRAAAPLPVSYDVNRCQPPYFSEYTYTECLGGGLYLSPQSPEVAARLVQMALDRPDQGFDAATAVIDQRAARGSLDKYKLDGADVSGVEAVAFIPGSNAFREMVSFEALSRAMADDDGLMIKPHPLSDDGLIAHLCGAFGHHRVLSPKISGDACLIAASRIYALTTTEMGLYATLMGKPISNIGNFWNEGRGAYSAFYRPLWGTSVDDAKAILTHALNSPFSGFVHKDDPDVGDRLAQYFDAAMGLRAFFKPLIATAPRLPRETDQAAK